MYIAESMYSEIYVDTNLEFSTILVQFNLLYEYATSLFLRLLNGLFSNSFQRGWVVWCHPQLCCEDIHLQPTPIRGSPVGSWVGGGSPIPCDIPNLQPLLVTAQCEKRLENEKID